MSAAAPDTPQLSVGSSSSSSSPDEPRSESASVAPMELEEQDLQSSQKTQTASSPAAALTAKRKAECDAKFQGAAASKKAKIASVSPSGLLEYTRGKLIYRPKDLLLQNQLPAVKQRVELQEYLSKRSKPIKAVPDEYHPALAKIIHESDKPLVEIARQARTLLYPETSAASTNDQDGKSTDILPLDVLKKTIKSIATRTNWGIRDAASVDLDLDPKSDSYILPAGLTIWAWEVQDRDLVVEDLTVDMANKVEARYKEREQVHADAIALLKALPRDERAALFTKGSKKVSAVKSTQKYDTTGGSTTEPIEINSETKSKTSEQQTKARPKAKQSDPEKEKAKADKEAEKKRIEEKKAEKQKEKEEKQKEKEEKQKEREAKAAEKAATKEEKDKVKAEKAVKKAEEEAAQALKNKTLKKQAGAFMGFFKTAPAEAPTSSPVRSQTSRNQSEDIPQTDFEQAFKDFHLTKGVICKYPQDYVKKGSSSRLEDILNSRQDDLSCSDVLSDILKGAKKSNIPPYRPRLQAPVSVREIMKNISEGDLVGSNAADRCRRTLRDRKKVPLKLLSFGATDRRPGYIGTWSKSSDIIRPRNPFAQDADMFTYDYDSEEEWEEEPEGGEDVNSDDARSQNSDSDHDSEVDDWMCDDDEVEFIEGYDGDAEEHQRDPEMAARNRALAKRERSNKDATARSKAPKALVPFSRGPVWESEYGKSLHSTFESMTICFINDAKSGLNPLTFHSSKRESSTATKTGSSLAQAQALSSTDQATGSPTGDVNKKSASAGPKGPRKPFPQELYPALIRIITSSESKNKADLLSELSKAFPNATKVAIEAELKEHVTKSKVNGSIVWVASSGLQDKAKKDDKMEVD